MKLIFSLNPFAWACFQEPTLDDTIDAALESLEFQQLTLIQELEDKYCALTAVQNKITSIKAYREAFEEAKTSSEKQTGKPHFLGIIGK